ncbi:MAG: diadenylate cyclase [Bacillota bacterium]
MGNLPHNIPPAEREKTRSELESLCHHALDTIAAIEAGAPCDDIFSIFSKVKATAASVDAALLTYHVQHCLVPGLRMFREILAAVNSLAARKTGALIAIERTDNLEKFISFSLHGTILDAEISAALLETVFTNGTPLHDGAVLIRENRVLAAGCILPLSSRTLSADLHHLGTRHRAALGLSELCDALVLVVSEETGRLSLAISGEMFTLNNAWELEERLRTMYD